MLMINFSNPVTLLIATILFVLVVLLARETKRSLITGVMLFTFAVILIVHTICYLTGSGSPEYTSSLIYTIVFDLIFMLISFISYLWIDDIEAKEKKKKSIDDSLNWFWEKV